MIHKKVNVRNKLACKCLAKFQHCYCCDEIAATSLLAEMYDDLLLIVRIHPHKLYKRLQNNDLECTLPITLHEALTGYKTSIPFLDGSSIDIDMSKKIIDPCTCLEFANKGMGTKNRLLRRKFDIKFPKSA